MQRVRMSLPYYQASGWDTTILTVAPRFVQAEQDPDLTETIPQETRVIQVSAVPYGIARMLGVGNLLLRSWLSLYLAGNKLLKREKYDLVFFSTTQFLTFSLGPLWLRRWKVPYVIDLQDPWQTDYYERAGSRKPPGGWKYQLARFLAWMLEDLCYRDAAGFISVSEEYLVDLKCKYPWFAQKPQATIKFGVSPGDAAVAKKTHSMMAWRDGGPLRIVYTGAAGPIMPHALNVLFQAVSEYRSQHPDKAAKLHFYFVGTSYAAHTHATPSVKPIAEKYGLGQQVTEIPYRLGHIDSLRVQGESDALLVLGSSDLAYSPSKIYPYYISGKPILSVIFKQSVLQKLLEELQCSTLAVFESNADPSVAISTIKEFFDLLLEGNPPEPSRNESLFRETYLAEHLAMRQAALFDTALQSAN